MRHSDKSYASGRHEFPALIMTFGSKMFPCPKDYSHGVQKAMKEKMASLGGLFQLPIRTILLFEIWPLGLCLVVESATESGIFLLLL